MKKCVLFIAAVALIVGAAGCSPVKTPPEGAPAEEELPPIFPAPDETLDKTPDETPDETPNKTPDEAAEPASPEKDVKEIEGLIRLADLEAGFIFDLKYATKENFVGRVIYPAAVAVLKRETAERLLQANAVFQADGYSIKIWDAYRPLSVQRVLWQACPDSSYVINPDPQPPVGGWKARHYNGMSVDLTLVDAHGAELVMPTGFDDFSEKAAPGYPGMSEEERRNVQYLISVMERAGFKPAPTEWWHFNDTVGEPTPYLDVPLEDFLD